MLMITRARKESIMIGEDVEIILTWKRMEKAELWVIAPGNIPVNSKEDFTAIKDEREQIGHEIHKWGNIFAHEFSIKTEKSIMIGEDVEVAIKVGTSREVKFGIIAPKEIPVYRTEVYGKNKQENKNEK